MHIGHFRKEPAQHAG